jgi:hypothetical protein
MKKINERYYRELIECINESDSPEEKYRKLNMELDKYKNRDEIVNMAISQFRGGNSLNNVSAYVGMLFTLLGIYFSIYLVLMADVILQGYDKLLGMFYNCISVVFLLAITKMIMVIYEGSRRKYKEGFILSFLEQQEKK